MRLIQHLAILSTFAALCASTGNAADVGVINFTFDTPCRERLVQAIVTYPAEGGGYIDRVGDNPVFRGSLLLRDAKPQRAKHNLVILSHGSGGNAGNVSWLAKKLAEAGFVVVAPNHQGSTSADSTPETTITATWDRKQDMTDLLDAIAASPSLSSITDISNVTAIGFSLGGQTVLGLADASLHATGLAKYCDENPASMECIWFAKGNPLIKGHVDLHQIDATKFDAAYIEKRVKRVVAVDPAFTLAYDTASLKAVTIPILMINLGDEGKIPLGIRADEIAANIPGAKLERVAGANHFTFLAECKLLGGLMIWLEGDDPVCREVGERSRGDMHDEIATKIVAFLKPMTP